MSDDYSSSYSSDSEGYPYETQDPFASKKKPSGGGGRGIIVVSLLLVGVLFGVVFFVASGPMKNSQPYQLGLQAAQSNSEVIAALGEPVEAGWPVTGEISLSGISGDADLSGPIHGPNGKGVLYVAGRKENGVWNFYTLAVKVKATGEIITLQSP